MGGGRSCMHAGPAGAASTPAPSCIMTVERAVAHHPPVMGLQLQLILPCLILWHAKLVPECPHPPTVCAQPHRRRCMYHVHARTACVCRTYEQEMLGRNKSNAGLRTQIEAQMRTTQVCACVWVRACVCAWAHAPTGMGQCAVRCGRAVGGGGGGGLDPRTRVHGCAGVRVRCASLASPTALCVYVPYMPCACLPAELPACLARTVNAYVHHAPPQAELAAAQSDTARLSKSISDKDAQVAGGGTSWWWWWWWYRRCQSLASAVRRGTHGLRLRLRSPPLAARLLLPSPPAAASPSSLPLENLPAWPVA